MFDIGHSRYQKVNGYDLELSCFSRVRADFTLGVFFFCREEHCLQVCDDVFVKKKIIKRLLLK